MGLVSITLPSDGTTADVADVNTPFTTIVTALNGNIDNSNISGVSGSKITAGTVAGTALDTNTQGGWLRGILPAVSSVTANGNHSYNVTFASTVASYLTPGMRVRSTRTVAAPTQCTSLNGTTQYYSKTSPAGMTFTDDFATGWWVKPTAYGASGSVIASRYNGTSGWALIMSSAGQVQLLGFNAGAANFKGTTSYQSIPLNKWTHIAAQIDMNTATTTSTTNYVMIDGVDVPTQISSGGTAPTALIQAGNLEIGSWNGGLLPFTGKIAQGAIYSAKVTQATILASMNQTLAGTETSLISAYSFNNVITDLNTTNANNLTANGSALATNADSPFSLDATGTPGATLDFGIVQKVATTVATIQVPEGNTIPTTGGVSSIDLSTSKAPFGMPVERAKWRLRNNYYVRSSKGTPTLNQAYNLGGEQLSLPIGAWLIGYRALGYSVGTSGSQYTYSELVAGTVTGTYPSSTGTSVSIKSELAAGNFINPATDSGIIHTAETPVSVAAATIYNLNIADGSSGTLTSMSWLNDLAPACIYAENAHL